MMATLKNDYIKLFSEYREGAKGPYKADAIVDYFESNIIEEMSNLVKDIDNAFNN
jgi:hypothetical protein